jgi:membrane protease YdiL (CAAX protease family)
VTSRDAVLPDGHPSAAAWAETRQVRRRGVRWFLIIAFAGAWVPWFGVHLAGGSLDDPVVQLLTAAFVPAAAACVVRRWITKQGFRDSGLWLNVRSSWRHYLAAVTIPWGLLVLAVGIAAVAGVGTPDWSLTASSWLYLAAGPVICIVMSPIFWGEEYGWTAYLRDRLVPGRPILTTFLTGLIWGLWHWPLPWVGYFGGGAQVSDAVWGMLLWLPLSILLEFLIGWLWSETGSVWPGAMLHAGNNMVASLGMMLLFGDTVGITGTTLLLCAALVPFVLAVILTGHTAGRAARKNRVTSGR